MIWKVTHLAIYDLTSHEHPELRDSMVSRHRSGEGNGAQRAHWAFPFLMKTEIKLYDLNYNCLIVIFGGTQKRPSEEAASHSGGVFQQLGEEDWSGLRESQK